MGPWASGEKAMLRATRYAGLRCPCPSFGCLPMFPCVDLFLRAPYTKSTLKAATTTHPHSSINALSGSRQLRGTDVLHERELFFFSPNLVLVY